MRLLLLLISLNFSLNTWASEIDYNYVKSHFFEKYQQVKSRAKAQNKPIVLVAGFESCLGCEEIKAKMKANEKAYSAVAEYMWFSTKTPDSFFFYSSLGIPLLSSAPETFIIKPGTEKAISMNRQVNIKQIKMLSSSFL